MTIRVSSRILANEYESWKLAWLAAWALLNAGVDVKLEGEM